jgi:hypothetical protein
VLPFLASHWSGSLPRLTRILPDAHPKRVERGAAAEKAQKTIMFLVYNISEWFNVLNLTVFTRSRHLANCHIKKVELCLLAMNIYAFLEMLLDS